MPKWTLPILTAALLALALVPAPALAASVTPPAVLPAVSKLLRAPSSGAACTSVGSYRAPMSGFLSARLRGSGDWDFALRDRRGAKLATSSGFGGNEVAQTWVQAGQKIVAEGCRGHGAGRDARVTFRLADIAPSSLATAIPKLVRVRGTQEQIQALEAAGLDVTHAQGRDWADVIVAGADQLAVLKRSGMGYTTRVSDLNRAYASARAADRRYGKRVGAFGAPTPTGRTSYRAYADYQAELKDLVEKNPGLVRKVVFGKSFQGREMSGVEIARNVDATDGRPVYFVMGVHHAREWPAGEAAMELAHLLVSEQSDPRISKLLDRERIVILPLVNPDGFVSSRGAFDPGDTLLGQDPNVLLVEAIAPPGGLFAYRRKNCNGEIFGPELPCELAWGVDNNRNYGNLWGGPGSSADVTSQGYHGPGPRSEAETQAVWNYVRTHHVTTLMTIHNVAALVLRPPGIAAGGKAPDEARMKEIGDAMGKATGYTSQYGFELYDTAGTTEDDSYAATGGYGYTIEIGPADGQFHMPYQTGFVNEWTGNTPSAGGNGGLREALLIAAEAAASTPDHAVVRGTAPAGKVLRLAKKFKTATSAYCEKGIEPLVTLAGSGGICLTGIKPPRLLDDEQNTTTTVPAGGSFEWHVGQSTRPFVGGGSVVEKLSEVSPPLATIAGAPGAPTGNVDHEFALPADQQADKLKVTLTSTLPEDYDIEVFQKQGDGSLKSVGTSGNPPGSPEEVVISAPAAGTYVVRVAYFAGASGAYEIKAVRLNATSQTTPGVKEAYTLTCEQSDGTVLETHSLAIDRGQSVGLKLGCGTGPSTFADGTPLGGDPNAQPSGQTPSVNGKPAPAAATKPGSAVRKPAKPRKLTRAQKLTACNKKARRIKRASKRRAALRSCTRKYGKKKAARRPAKTRRSPKR